MTTAWVKEINVFQKSRRAIECRIGIVYPNTYSVGMSGLSVKLLYHLLNQHQNVFAERIFQPRKKDVVPTSLESNKVLSNFDILAFTFQFELDYINAIKMLQMSNIPVLSKDRSQNHPIIIAGGPAITANPEPILNIFDFVFMGEFETVSKDFLENIINNKDTSFSDSISSLPGFYSNDNYNQKNPRVITSNLDDVDYPTTQVRPVYTSRTRKGGLDGFFLQISRGCPHGCQFCLIGKIFKPHRERSIKILKKIIQTGAKETQTDYFSLIGSSTADYSQINDLIQFFNENHLKFTLPSIRIDSGKGLLDLLRNSGQRSLTIAPEVGSNESRFSIGKRITNEAILSFASRAERSNITNLKTYFIMGLTSDPLKEAQDILDLITDLKTTAPSISYNVSNTPLVPKRHTKFENRKIDYNEINEGLNLLKSKIPSNVKFRSFPTRWAVIQAILSIGKEDLLPILIRVASQGGSYQSWKKNLDPDPLSFYKNLLT